MAPKTEPLGVLVSWWFGSFYAFRQLLSTTIGDVLFREVWSIPSKKNNLLRCSERQLSYENLSENDAKSLNMSGRTAQEATGLANIESLVSWRRGGEGSFQTGS